MSSRVLLLILWMLLAVPSSAHAYVDPGTGAMLWQLILAMVAGALFFIREIRARLFAALRFVARRNRK